MTRVFNFSAGPSMLPQQVLHQIKHELYNWNHSGVSVMEISHRSREFFQLAQETKKNLRELLHIPDNYKILFCHGGGRGQFSAVPINLLTTSLAHADYINTGFWSYSAAMEAKKYCMPKIINVCNETNKLISIKTMAQWDISANSTYIHYCPNETINGISVYEDPDFHDKIVVADCSSMLLSRPLNVNKFGIIYAAAQKNIGISGLTIVIIKENLLIHSQRKIPSILNYAILDNCDSMFNTPVTISWYIANLIFKWLKSKGGLQIINRYNQEKANLLYNAIDTNDLYYNNVNVLNRSDMNVPFFLKQNKLEDLFLSESLRYGLHGLKGHRILGGIRASLYNAMTLEGVKELVQFMEFFSKKYG